jgi:hypothetical protein
VVSGAELRRCEPDPASAETEPPPNELLPPRERRTPLKRTAARMPGLHRLGNAMGIERSDLTLETLPTNADQEMPTPSGPATLYALASVVGFKFHLTAAIVAEASDNHSLLL